MSCTNCFHSLHQNGKRGLKPNRGSTNFILYIMPYHAAPVHTCRWWRISFSHESSRQRLLVERFWRPQLHQIEERGTFALASFVTGCYMGFQLFSIYSCFFVVLHPSQSWRCCKDTANRQGAGRSDFGPAVEGPPFFVCGDDFGQLVMRCYELKPLGSILGGWTSIYLPAIFFFRLLGMMGLIHSQLDCVHAGSDLLECFSWQHLLTAQNQEKEARQG